MHCFKHANSSGKFNSLPLECGALLFSTDKKQATKLYYTCFIEMCQSLGTFVKHWGVKPELYNQTHLKNNSEKPGRWMR